MQTSDENKTKYQSGDYKLIQYQILQTNITRTVWQTDPHNAMGNFKDIQVNPLTS